MARALDGDGVMPAALVPSHLIEACLASALRSVTTRTVDGVHHETIHVFKAGYHVGQHAHVYPHTTVVVRGALEAFADGASLGVFTAVSDIYIAAGVKHRFVILDDDTVYSCIHNVGRTGDIQVAAEHRIEEAV